MNEAIKDVLTTNRTQEPMVLNPHILPMKSTQVDNAYAYVASRADPGISVDLQGIFLEACTHWTERMCAQQLGKLECCSTKTHFQRVIHPITDIRLGNCNFLDTCFSPDTCPYVHWEPVLPEEGITKYAEETATLFMAPKKTPAKWYNANILRMDLKLLGNFTVIIMDPPWEIHMNLPYTRYNDAELCRLDIPCLQDNGILFFWCTTKNIEAGIRCLTAWGYKYQDEIIWVKTTQLGSTTVSGRTGHFLNHAKEHCLVGIKGRPVLNKGIDFNYIMAPARETSRKPEELYEIIDRLVSPNARKLELFGRQHNIRDGWTTVGDQIGQSRGL